MANDKVKDLGPLTWNVPIVDPNSGRPSPEFQRRWETLRANDTQIGAITIGNGPPTGMPADGAEYVDASTTPYTLYIGKGESWHQVGVVKFLDLSDAPHSYTSFGGYYVRVNPGATGLEFRPPAPVGFSISMAGLNAAGGIGGPSSYANDVIFDTSSICDGSCEFAPTSTVVWTVSKLVGVTFTPMFTLTWAAGVKTSPTFALSSGSVTLPVGTSIYVLQPNVADATFANATASITGTL